MFPMFLCQETIILNDFLYSRFILLFYIERWTEEKQVCYTKSSHTSAGPQPLKKENMWYTSH